MKILIVDDDEAYAYLLAEKLRKLEPTFLPSVVATAAGARAAVEQAAEPFDVFLLDRQLDGSDVDGITLMQQLMRQSIQRRNDCDAIIITGYDDLESGLRAFEAGAHRYLTKPFDTRELAAILKVLEKTQSSRREGNWLRILSEIAAATQKATTVLDVGQILCAGAQRLGFERARLWKLAEGSRPGAILLDETEFEGVCEAGHTSLPGFQGLRLPLRQLPYSRMVHAAGEAGFFVGRPEPSGLDLHYGAAFSPPLGEWAKLPLLAEEHCIGFLVLDNAENARLLSPEQRTLLRLFGHQAAAALSRALEQEETQLLLEIGREITKQAAANKLDDLLDTVREQIRKVMPVDNSIIVLLDEDSKHLEFRRQYESDQLLPRHWTPYPSCLCGDVIQENKPLLLPSGGEEYRSRRGIPLCGKPSSCWLGVPLRTSEKAIGAIAVQDYKVAYKFGPREERLLLAIADQVAGAISLAYTAEREAQASKYQESYMLLRSRLRRFAEENEYWFWHAVLTVVTHQDGLRFNRAALFMFDESGANLQGLMGIGYFTCAATHKAWEDDEKSPLSFQEYLRQPDLARQKPTPLQGEITRWQWKLGSNSDPCAQMRRDGQRRILPSNELQGSFPERLLNPPDLPENVQAFECALVPVKARDRVLGVLLVDNFVDGKSVRPSDLDRLEQLLAEAAQVWLGTTEARQIQEENTLDKNVLELSRRIMGQAANRPLKESLVDLCQQAQAITNASYVVVYPYRSAGDSYDIELVSYSDGLRDQALKTKNKPRQQGVTFSILQSGTLAVFDVATSGLFFGGRALTDHDFVKREQIEAFIGAPMRSTGGEPLGVIYLDYRSPQQFTQKDIACAEQIAGIGADVVRYVRMMDQVTQSRADAAAREQLRQRAMYFLSNVQRQALSSDSDEEKVIRSILANTSELFGGKAKVVMAMLAWRTEEERTCRTRKDYHLNMTGKLNKKPVHDVYDGLLGKSLQLADEQPGSVLPCMDKNAIATPILLGRHPVGSLLVRRRAEKGKQPAVDEFSDAEQEVLEQLATVAALALDNVRSRTLLQSVAYTQGVGADPRNLEDTLHAIVDQAINVAPDIDCINIWYQDADQGGRLVAGPQWGVLHNEFRRENASTSKLVDAVMKLRSPVFCSEIEHCTELENAEWLHGDFTKREEIKSTAAFPLHTGEDKDALGALFLSYRDKPHVFTASERTLFPIFANVAAMAIHQAQLLHEEKQGAARLDAALTVANEVGTEFDLSEVLRKVLLVLKQHFDRPSVEVQPYVMLYDEDDDSLYLPLIAKEFMAVDNPRYKEELRLRLDGHDRGVVCQVAREALRKGEVYVKNFGDIREDRDYLNFNSMSVSLLCAGLVTKKKGTDKTCLWGVLAVSSPEINGFNQQDRALLELTARQALIALERTEQAARLRFKDAVSSVTTWAAELAHDINKEVGAIRNRVYWLRDEKMLSENGRQWLEEIGAGAARLVDVTRSVRTDQQMDIQRFDLCQMLSERVRSLVQQRWPNTIVVTDFDSDSIWVNTYGERLWRGVRHLVRNAADAMDGDGTLTIRTRNHGDKIEIQIEDTGHGVPTELRDILLQQPYTTKGGLYDRGYGLLIARQLIESIDGQIRILPHKPSSGAIFSITLPHTPVRVS